MEQTDTRSAQKSEPRYLKVTRDITEQISNGRFPVGSYLPNEADLCTHYDVSRTTVREALRQLSDQGLVEKRHGVGTMVCATSEKTNYVMSVSYTDLTQYGQDSSLKILDRRFTHVDDDLSKVIGATTGEYWAHLRALRINGSDPENPVSLLQIFIPERFSSVAYETSERKEPYHVRIMERYNFKLAGVEQEIRATSLSDPDQAELLNASLGSPGLHVVRRYFGPSRELFQSTINLHPADRFGYSLYLNYTG